mgnify:CR=1 FL=1|tara:strand:+ start:11684 stop:14095 length:2412 start_codon:yes stop_codon:yes gene_type:complete
MSESERLTCSICLETINDSDEKIQCVRTETGGCDNFFHKNCIIEYCNHSENNVCPMCRNSRICDEIRSQRFEELPDGNTEYILDEIATNFMRPPPTWPTDQALRGFERPRSIVNMQNLERMPLNILLQIRDLFEAEIEAQRRLIASNIPVTETQRQELEQRGELSIESINNRSTEIRRRLMIAITRIIMTELIRRNFDAVDASGARIPLGEAVWNEMMDYSDSDNSIDSNQTRRSIISRPSQSDSENGRRPSSGVPSIDDSSYNGSYFSENERSSNSSVHSQSDSESDSNANSQPVQTTTDNQVASIAAQIVESGLPVEDVIAMVRRREPQLDAVDAEQDAYELLNEEESEHEPELNVDENVDEITNLFEQINQNDAQIARLRNQTNEQSSEAFDSENVSAEGGAPKIESPEEEQQFVENLSNLDILQTTQNTDSSGNIITKREPTFLGNENLVEENESKNANMKESYPLNKTHEKWTGDNDSNHEKKIKIFHNWLKNIFRRFKPNSPDLTIILTGRGLGLGNSLIDDFNWDWISATNENHIEALIDKINNLSNENKKRLFVDLTIGTVLITGYTHPDNDIIDLDLEFIFEKIENWMHFVRRVENSPRRLSSGSTTNDQQIFDISIGKGEREWAGEWSNDDNDNIIFSLEIKNLNYSQLLSEYNSNDNESLLTGRMSLIEAIHTFKLNMKRLLKIRNIRSDYIDLSKFASLRLFGGGPEEDEAANILLTIKDAYYPPKRSHKKRPDSPILLKNSRNMYECPNCKREFTKPQAQIQHCKSCVNKTTGGNKKTRKRRLMLQKRRD